MASRLSFIGQGNIRSRRSNAREGPSGPEKNKWLTFFNELYRVVGIARVPESISPSGLTPAIRVRLVMDNLNTHNAASLYETFEPEETRRLARRLEIHYNPKYGSWLNVGEIDLSVLNSQGSGVRAM